MVIFLITLLVLVLGFVISYLTVNLIMYNRFFKKQPSERMEKGALRDSYYNPFLDEIKSAVRRMEKLPFERVTCLSRDNLNLSAKYYANKKEKIVVFCHGVHAVPWNNFSVIGEDFYKAGYDILLIEQRAHWQSEGKYITYGISEGNDILCWLEWLKSSPVKEIVLYGVSMGAASIAFASDKITDQRVKAMVLDCGFTSFNDLRLHIFQRIRLPFWMAYFAFLLGRKKAKIPLKENTKSHLSKTTIPTLFIHGDADYVVPKEHSIANFEACSARKELIIVEKAGHAVACVQGGLDIRKRILDFVGK